jgi:large subunit ribosomal protein L10
LKGGENKLAVTKERKNQLVSEYGEWLKRSQVLILTEYKGLSMSNIDALRSKIRELGGEFHIVKNTLGKLAVQQAGLSLPKGFFEGSTAVVFAFEDAPAVAKAMTDFAKSSEFLKIKGGYLDKKPMSEDGVKSLAELPPLPVMRSRILGMLLTPAGKLVRTLAEPARSLAAVINAHAEPATA